MISIECREMTVDEQLALASSISEGLAGKGVALVKDSSIVLDMMSEVEAGEVVALVRIFVSKRKDAQYYSVGAEGEHIIVHTPDPLSRSRGRKDTGQLLPDNLLKCPFCPFVTPYQELYNVHFRSHGFGI
jgi:hypothetical protein